MTSKGEIMSDNKKTEAQKYPIRLELGLADLYGSDADDVAAMQKALAKGGKYCVSDRCLIMAYRYWSEHNECSGWAQLPNDEDKIAAICREMIEDGSLVEATISPKGYLLETKS